MLDPRQEELAIEEYLEWISIPENLAEQQKQEAKDKKEEQEFREIHGRDRTLGESLAKSFEDKIIEDFVEEKDVKKPEPHYLKLNLKKEKYWK